MRSPIFVLVAALLIGFVPFTAHATDVGSLVCGTTAVPPLQELPGTLAFFPGDAMVEARIVFVGFPNNDTLTVPVWADELPAQLADYFQAMSRGRQQMNVSIIRRPSPSQDLAWIAPQPASFYVQGGGGYGAVNRDAMEAIAQTFDGIWEDVEMVFMMHAQCTFPCTDPSTQSNCEYTCPWGGVQGLALPTPVTDFMGVGVTQRYFYWPNVNTDQNRQGLPWVAAHEYGHWLQFDHTAGSGTGAPNTVNPGKYDVMRSSASFVSALGLLPYASLHLSGTQLAGGWVPRQVITTDTEGLRVPDVRGPAAAVIQVIVPGTNQSFFLSNHQGTTAYDAKYGRNGLVVWHEFRDSFGTLRAGTSRARPESSPTASRTPCRARTPWKPT